MESMLHKMGYDPSFANNGQSALELALKNKFDIIFMDIHMPIMDGYQASRAIHETLKLPDIPIIALTANIMPEVKKQCKEAGMNDYLPKPIDYHQLLLSLAHVMKFSMNDKDMLNNLLLIEHKKSLDNDINQETMLLTINLPGIDLAIAYQYLGNDISKVSMTLIQFTEKYSGSITEIKELIKQEEYQQVAEILHGIKGVSGMLGATKLLKNGVLLEQLLRSKPLPLTKLQQYLQQFFLTINEVFATSEYLQGKLLLNVTKSKSIISHSGEQNQLKSEQVQSFLLLISTYLHENNMKVEDLLPEFKAVAIGQLADDEINNFEQYVIALNFKQAQEILKKLASQFNISLP
jgi:CheY-like chemotaxis protein